MITAAASINNGCAHGGRKRVHNIRVAERTFHGLCDAVLGARV